MNQTVSISSLMSNLSNKMNNDLVLFLKVKFLLQIPQRDCRQIFAKTKTLFAAFQSWCCESWRRESYRGGHLTLQQFTHFSLWSLPMQQLSSLLSLVPTRGQSSCRTQLCLYACDYSSGKSQVMGEIKIALKKEMKTEGEHLVLEILQCRNITYKFKTPDHLPGSGQYNHFLFF